MPNNLLIIGAGLSGATLAHSLSKISNCHIDIWDERDHIGGNCFTKRDEQTGVMVHEYGPHIFNTDKKEIWDFVNSFTEFMPYVHRVKAISKGKIYPLPVNLDTINRFFEKNFSPDEAKFFLATLADENILEPKNFEEQALSLIGKDLYKAFFYGYTKKQWGCEPSELPASILKRIPVRFNYDDNYHNNFYTGIPIEGYTHLIQKMIDAENVHVHLNKKWIPGINVSSYDHIFYTGPIDAFFNHKYGRLGYRTVRFEKFYGNGDMQGVAQINYCDEDIPYTRITEHKHFAYWEQHRDSVCFKEFSEETGEDDIPYYPKRLFADKKLLLKYRSDAEKLINVSFLGRLATYRYMDMHHVIGEAIRFAEKFIAARNSSSILPVFPNEEPIYN